MFRSEAGCHGRCAPWLSIVTRWSGRYRALRPARRWLAWIHSPSAALHVSRRINWCCVYVIVTFICACCTMLRNRLSAHYYARPRIRGCQRSRTVTLPALRQAPAAPEQLFTTSSSGDVLLRLALAVLTVTLSTHHPYHNHVGNRKKNSLPGYPRAFPRDRCCPSQLRREPSGQVGRLHRRRWSREEGQPGRGRQEGSRVIRASRPPTSAAHCLLKVRLTRSC